MWYFSWILGVLLACSLGIINVLRLEAQEALAKENVAVDPLTQLLAKESVLERLQEKVENSKRNEMPFSLLYISLTDFKIKHQLEDYEMDITLLRLVSSLNKDIRSSLDIAARVGDEEFLIALPGAPLNSAKMIAHKIKSNIFSNVKTPDETPVEINIGVAEFTHYADFISKEAPSGMDEVEALLKIAIESCFESTVT